ncbi:hypothetical protein CcCBS67573_g02406 [Chytriomyces confervae]|uniref:CAF1B/HIR1 beta-propeller domain-containing protein n=1 Tax=Chytriomyces confervae TaxID=246404 RepID=A0A507FJE2_9FUNG|nr:hypothetical protein HDU80_010759 [Chytriomyces hyalinus]TPX76342.1 hypothetical protein CcCBS67573_g02406 [Chytriomyces confervae]
MKAKTLQINWHDKMPLFSVAFNSETVLETSPSSLDGDHGEPSQINKLATAGGDHNIRLWNVTLDDVSNTSKVDYVATLNRHSSVVNCIRWSNSGSILASGGDDGTLILWQQADKKSQDLNSLESAEDLESKEYWKVLSLLRGCSSDIYDIVWSPDSNFVLAGCLDNSARIWNVRENRCIHVLTDHENFVQGVSWDPLNHFIATQSSDRTMHVYSLERLADVGHESINVQCIAKQARVKTIRTVVDEFASLGLVEPIVGATVSKGTGNEDMDVDGLPTKDGSENHCQSEASAQDFEEAKYETSIAKKLKLEATSAEDTSSNHNHSGELSSAEPNISDMPASTVPLIATISTANMFHDDTLSSFFRRLTFSPDGSLLVVPAGLHRETTKDTPKNVVYLFTRENLRGDPIARLGGFKKPVIAARFSPVLYEHRNKSESNPSSTKLILPYRMMFAVASPDSVVVYDTSRLEKPVAIVSNLHYGTLTDVAWSQNGRVLVLASTDGYCSIINFTKSELGQVHAAAAPLVENQNLFTTAGTDLQKALKENNGQTVGSSVNLLHSGLIKKKKAAVVVAPSEAVTGPDGVRGDCGEENRKGNCTDGDGVVCGMNEA